MLWEETKDKEYFLENEHRQSVGWDCPKLNNYKYITDAEVLGDDEGPTQKAQFHVKSLIHATTPNAAVKILSDGGFKPGHKNLGRNVGEKNLIWWNISLNDDDVEKYKQVCKEKILSIKYDTDVQEKLKDDLYSNLCSSPPFSYPSRYGNIKFKYDIDTVLKAYKTKYCDNENPVFQVIGTFAYQMEVMHAILVRPDNTNRPSPTRENSVIFKENKKWIWTPESTGLIWNIPRKYTVFRQSRRWEHAAFAFLIPDEEDDIFRFDDLVKHMAYCPPGDCFRWHTDKSDRDKWTFQKTIRFLEDQKISPKAHLMTPEQLLNFISKHLRHNWRQKGRTIEDENEKECNADCRTYNGVDPGYIEHLLIRMETACPHELLEMAKSPSNPAERWKDWILKLS